MSLIVQKYGGTSVGSVEKIGKVADKVAALAKSGTQVVVAVSAMSGETNRLLALANEMSAKPSARELDVIVSTGEQVTIALLTMALLDRGCEARSYTGSQIRMVTDNVHGKARIKDIQCDNMRADLEAGRVVVVAGFQGVDEEGNITTLGRGGSDTTAVAIAAALKADECQIYSIPMSMVFIRPTRGSSQKQESWIKSLLKKCWRWPAWVQKFCKFVR